MWYLCLLMCVVCVCGMWYVVFREFVCGMCVLVCMVCVFGMCVCGMCVLYVCCVVRCV